MAATTSCRSCGEAGLTTFLDLGDTPLADALVPADTPAGADEVFPLAVAFCPHCSLVQITEEVPPEKLFVDNYLYFSSFSDHLLRHSRENALAHIERQGLGPDSFVVEVASNDGYLLKNFVEAGIPVLGIDPAPTQAAAAEANGVPTLAEFFGVDLARQLAAERGKADVIIANNVMAHVPDLNGFISGYRELLKDTGVVTVENPCARDLIEHGEFDTIYHEHHCYFSTSAVNALVRRNGLFLNHVEHFPNLHGGTLRWHLGKHDEPSEAVTAQLREEEELGMLDIGYYKDFGTRVEAIRDGLVALLRDLKAQGKTIAAYGAAAKGATLVNYAGIDTELVDFVVDRNVHKQGLLMPGVHIPIVGPEALVERKPDYTLLLAWNFKDEIVAQQDEYRRGGGQFIVPVPEPQVVA
jgi:SAM-dependent methyltransferase